MGIISVTYAFSVERINSQSQTLKVSTAKQNLISLNDAVLSTLFQPGTSRTFDLSDSGGQTSIKPTSNALVINISVNSEVLETIFNASVGKIIYELPSSRSSNIGLYLKGDSRSIINQSGSSMSQMCIQRGNEHPEIQLRFRPLVTYAIAGLENNKVVNNIRIHIVNLNSSSSISLFGELPLQISCTTTQLISKNYEVSSAAKSLLVTSVLDNTIGRVLIPISNTPQGAVINLEIVISNVSIQRWIR